MPGATVRTGELESSRSTHPAGLRDPGGRGRADGPDAGAARGGAGLGGGRRAPGRHRCTGGRAASPARRARPGRVGGPPGRSGRSPDLGVARRAPHRSRGGPDAHGGAPSSRGVAAGVPVLRDLFGELHQPGAVRPVLTTRGARPRSPARAPRQARVQRSGGGGAERLEELAGGHDPQPTEGRLAGEGQQVVVAGDQVDGAGESRGQDDLVFGVADRDRQRGSRLDQERPAA